MRIPTRSMQYPGILSGRKPTGFPVRSPRLCRTRLKIPIPSSAGETNQNMTRSSHRKWGQAINACPHFAKSNRLVGAIFAKHIGSVSAAASENLSLPFYPSDCTVQRGTETGSKRICKKVTKFLNLQLENSGLFCYNIS